MTFESEFESSYSVDDLFVGKVSIIGLYKGKIRVDDLKNSFEFFQEIGQLQNYFNTNKHVFRNIFFFVPMLSIKDGIIIQYYPNNEDGKDIKPLGITLNFKPE